MKRVDVMDCVYFDQVNGYHFLSRRDIWCNT